MVRMHGIKAEEAASLLRRELDYKPFV